MQTPNSRRIAVIGVVIAAIAAVLVLRPALHSFGYGQLNWAGLGYAGIPLALLWATGARYHGIFRSAVIATTATVVAVGATAALFVLALGLSLSGSGSAGMLLALLWVLPPLVILVLGLAAARFLRPRTPQTV